ncbi:ABC transporter permease [Larkinella soli]|uniref:ABC transporter permease n=1 Tax=Larkinella soli TaxID=1770527 RepID=UPI0019D0FF95|nr:ABC transporter permease [Larkinella soli]
MKPQTMPPRWAGKLLEWCCAPHLLEEVEGDLYERFGRNMHLYGEKTARRLYAREVLGFLRPQFLKRKQETDPKPFFVDMLRNYFTVAFRNLSRNKSYAFINVAGLALGLAACIVIFLVVRNELTYDAFHARADRTYRVTLNGIDFNPSVSFAVAPALRNDFPELELVSQYYYEGESLIKVGNERFREEGLAWADQDFPRVFDFDWIEGNPATALKEPNTVVLTETVARKYFGEAGAVGRIIGLDNRHNLRVSGVIRDLPSNTHLTFRYLASWETVRKEVNLKNFWSIQGGNLFAVLPPKLDIRRIEARLPDFLVKNWPDQFENDKAKLLMQPLREIHFDQRYLSQASSPRSKGTIYGLAGIAVFIILSACINFVNLATAQAVRRSKEVGVRKVMGAQRSQLVGQVLGETAILVAVSVLLALAAVRLFIPYSLPLLNIRIDPSHLVEPAVIGVILALVCGTILLAGLYPALVQSGFQPIIALKSRMTSPGGRSLTLRKGLVILQFTFSQVLIIGTLVVARQMDFFRNQDLGFDKEAIVLFPAGQKADILRQKLKENPGVAEFSFSSANPATNSSFMPFSAPEYGMNENDVTELKLVDEAYMPMFKLELLAGEPIARQTSKDTVGRVVVNQTLIRRLGFRNPQDAIGKRFLAGDQPAQIRGVVKDFQSESKHRKIRACILAYNTSWLWQVSVKLRPEGVPRTLAALEREWQSMNPDDVFHYEFLDQHIDRIYTQEEKMYNAFRLFAGIAILIGSLGLYGLVSLMAVQRTREVGIRKVLGASVGSIVGLFSREFVWLMAIAFLIAAPVAWWAMDGWLREFAYHISIGPALFLVAVLTTFGIAALTVSYQSIRAALANPIKSLKTE